MLRRAGGEGGPRPSPPRPSTAATRPRSSRCSAPCCCITGMVLVGLPYSAAGQMRLDEITGGSPYGATTVAGAQGERQPSEHELGSPASRDATSRRSRSLRLRRADGRGAAPGHHSGMAAGTPLSLGGSWWFTPSRRCRGAEARCAAGGCGGPDMGATMAAEVGNAVRVDAAAAAVALEVVPTGAALGAEVLGVDLRWINNAAFDTVHAAWLAHSVLLFRGQSLSDDDLVSFSRASARWTGLRLHRMCPRSRGSRLLACCPPGCGIHRQGFRCARWRGFRASWPLRRRNRMTSGRR